VMEEDLGAKLALEHQRVNGFTEILCRFTT
jgi:hypothetical protein